MLRLLPVSLFTREWIEISIFLFCCRCPVVSLFTREWIEIYSEPKKMWHLFFVSLFTREWIEIATIAAPFISAHPSPSLRGSGLKFCIPPSRLCGIHGLPLYEGVDWNCSAYCLTSDKGVSLFTREWIEIFEDFEDRGELEVSLFTREWIEISDNQ